MLSSTLIASYLKAVPMGFPVISARIYASIVLMLAVLAIPCCAGQCESQGSCYITPAGAGRATGVDWNNAYADLPSSLARGVTYFIAGSATSYASHVFNDADSGTKTITLYKAVDCSVGSNNTTVPYCPGGSAPLYAAGQGPQTIPGWSPSFATTTATWSDAPMADPTAWGATKMGPAFWQVCTDYYTFDGITGSTLPTSVGGQGFVISTQNIRNMVTFGDYCPAANRTNVSFNHLEVGGTGSMPYWGSPVTGCTWNGAQATITTSSDIGADGTTDIKVDGWTSKYSPLFAVLPASPISSTQVVVPLASNPCSSLYWVALDLLPNTGIKGMNHLNFPDTITNLTIQNSYIHDLALPIWVMNGSNLNILHNYLARSRSTPYEHGSTVEFNENPGTNTISSITVAYNFFLDGGGTGWITNLNNSPGMLNGLYVYGNIFTCSGSPLVGCGAGDGTVCAINGTILTNSVFYNNTIANVRAAVGFYAQNAKDTGNAVKNNLFYNTPGTVYMQEGGGVGIHDYNTILNGALVWSSKPCASHETCIGSGAADPFVNDAGYDFHLLAPMSASAHSGKPAAQGTPLPAPYNVDFAGMARGLTGTWARGAYEYTLPAPPTNISTTAH
jgi:hypothetical protein